MHTCVIMSQFNIIYQREKDQLCITYYTQHISGSDDPDNPGHLGHFFVGSSGSHMQTT